MTNWPIFWRFSQLFSRAVGWQEKIAPATPLNMDLGKIDVHERKKKDRKGGV
jgi:hypothetical protein